MEWPVTYKWEWESCHVPIAVYSLSLSAFAFLLTRFLALLAPPHFFIHAHLINVFYLFIYMPFLFLPILSLNKYTAVPTYTIFYVLVYFILYNFQDLHNLYMLFWWISYIHAFSWFLVFLNSTCIYLFDYVCDMKENLKFVAQWCHLNFISNKDNTHDDEFDNVFN